MNSSSTEYLLLEKNGTVPRSILMMPNRAQGPVIQALNMGFLPYPMPPAIHSEFVRSEMRLVELSPAQLELMEAFPEIMGRAVAVDPRHWYEQYRLARRPANEWGYEWKDLVDKIPVVDQGQGLFALDVNSAKKMATDLQLLYLSIKEIQKHSAFTEGTLLPSLLKTSCFFRRNFTSSQQIRTLVGLAQIAFCTGMAFVNGWRIVIGAGWDSTLMPGCLEFIKCFKLNLLPLRGAVFNLDQSFDCHALNRYLKNYGPVFIVHPGNNHPQRYRFLRCDHEVLSIYHCFNDVNMLRLNRNLRVEEIPNLANLLRDIKDTDTYLQRIRTVTLCKFQPRIHESTEVYINLTGGWKLILVTTHSVWVFLRYMYVYLEVRHMSENCPGRIHFFLNQPIRYEENSLEATKAATVRARAERDGTLALVESLPECYATTHVLSHPIFTNFPSLPLPYFRMKEISSSLTIAPPPLVYQGNVPSAPPSGSSDSTFQTSPSPAECVAPPASPATVEAFLLEVSKEIERRMNTQTEFWPDEGNRKTVLPVPGHIRRATQLGSEEEGKYLLKQKNVTLIEPPLGATDRRQTRRATPYLLAGRTANSKMARMIGTQGQDSLSEESSLRSNSSTSNEGSIDSAFANSSSHPSTIDLTLSPLALEYPSTAVLNESVRPHDPVNGRVPGYARRPEEDNIREIAKSGFAPDHFIHDADTLSMRLS